MAISAAVIYGCDLGRVGDRSSEAVREVLGLSPGSLVEAYHYGDQYGHEVGMVLALKGTKIQSWGVASFDPAALAVEPERAEAFAAEAAALLGRVRLRLEEEMEYDNLPETPGAPGWRLIAAR